MARYLLGDGRKKQADAALRTGTRGKLLDQILCVMHWWQLGLTFAGWTCLVAAFGVLSALCAWTYQKGNWNALVWRASLYSTASKEAVANFFVAL
mmetsp:Transcript_132637/g.264712  ORF Transcript_132637/g.264712 Transcript_132637/m.264712 type:complete len:95 (-) Transcript_132637:318-602(-)